MKKISDKARKNPKKIVFPESTEERTLKAVSTIVKEKTAKPVLLGSPKEILEKIKALKLSPAGIEIIDHLILRPQFDETKEYDLVFANILENILTLEKPVIGKSVRVGGFLILSGILNEQSDRIKREYEGNNQFETIEIASKGDWSALLMRRIK